MAVSYLHYFYPLHPENLESNQSLRHLLNAANAASLIDSARALQMEWIDGPSSARKVQQALLEQLEFPEEDADEIVIRQRVDFGSDVGPIRLFDFGRRTGTPRKSYELRFVWSHYPRIPRFALPVGVELNCRSCWSNLVDDEHWGRLHLDPRVYHVCPSCGHKLVLSESNTEYKNPADPEAERPFRVVPCAVYRLALVVDTHADWPLPRIDHPPLFTAQREAADQIASALSDTLIELGGFW